MSVPAEAALRRVLASYAADPVGYATDVLGATLTPDQRALPALLDQAPYRLLVPSGNKLGKTFALGWLINWHFDSFNPGITLVTSATWTSLTTQTFKEVRKLRPLARDLLPRAPSLFDTDQHQVIGYSPKNPDAAQGHHAAHWFLFMDEATAVPVEIADRAETMFSAVKGHRWICTYNPNDPTTWPYAAEQSGGWAVKRLSALEHPNVLAELRGEPPPFPGAVRLHRIRERILKECEDCGQTREDESCFRFLARAGENERWWKPVKPEFDPQVRGRWPQQSMHAIWGESEQRRCEQSVELEDDWPVQIGVDMARFGNNRPTWAVRKGTALVHLEERTSWPTRRVSYHAAELTRSLCHKYAPVGCDPKRIPCLIDDTGGYGSGVVDYPDGYTFIGVNSSETARDPKQYANRRAELWFLPRLAADQGGFYTGNCAVGRHLLPQLWEELKVARSSPDKKNRRIVEGKAAIKERLRRSPDLADAVALAWYPVD
jgi:hypothetical protein